MSPASTTVRVVAGVDRRPTRELQQRAFGPDGESVARLVDRLRGSAGHRPELDLLAERDGQLVGHVMVTDIDLELEPGRRQKLGCLSPLGVDPGHQRGGVGRALVEAALQAASRAGESAVVLEGNPALYSRLGFERALPLGLRRPSERIPEPAFQVARLPGWSPQLRGWAQYPEPFWAEGAVGLPVTGLCYLDGLQQYCRVVEEAVQAQPAALGRAVPACPGWNVADLLTHLGAQARQVPEWVRGGRRPGPGWPIPVPPEGQELGWFGQGWRDLHAAMDVLRAQDPAASWCPWDDTSAFWRRRMLHEHAVHALDVAQALGGPWSVSAEVAQDGIDEVLRLYLGTRFDAELDGRGRAVQVRSPGRAWTVGLDPGRVEVNEVACEPDAVLSGSARALYAWLWGRDLDDEQVSVSGDAGALTDLQRALAFATR